MPESVENIGSGENIQNTELDLNHKVVLILVGLIGSGKSSFAEALQHHFPQFIRCSQDELGDRQSVESLAKRSLQEGLSVCIDRTNIDASQRCHWVNIAYEFPGTATWVLFFDTPFDVCTSRIEKREDHPTIKDVETGRRVLARFASTFEDPSMHEGFDRILRIKPSDHFSSMYTREDILDILHRVQMSPPPDFSASPSSSRGGPVFCDETRNPFWDLGRGHWRRGSSRDRRVAPPSTLPWTTQRGDLGRGTVTDHGYASGYRQYSRGVTSHSQASWRERREVDIRGRGGVGDRAENGSGRWTNGPA